MQAIKIQTHSAGKTTKSIEHTLKEMQHSHCLMGPLQLILLAYNNTLSTQAYWCKSVTFPWGYTYAGVGKKEKRKSLNTAVEASAMQRNCFVSNFDHSL